MLRDQNFPEIHSLLEKKEIEQGKLSLTFQFWRFKLEKINTTPKMSALVNQPSFNLPQLNDIEQVIFY